MTDSTRAKHLVRFTGRLWENMIFEHVPGWETGHVAQIPDEGDGTYQVSLLDQERKILVSVSPSVELRSSCDAEGTSMRLAELKTYVPLHPDARELIFHRAELMIFRAPIASAPPVVTITDLVIRGDDQAELRWRAEHSLPLAFTVVYIVGQEKLIVARGLETSEYTIDLRLLPGSADARLSVLATDGLRSSFVVSEPFSVAPKPPLIWIQSPVQKSALPADQPVTLNGQALDIVGFGLDIEPLIWRVDGEVVARGTKLAMAYGLQVGTHEVQLEYAPDGETLALETVSITIVERNPAQEEFLRLLVEAKRLQGD